jgi:hypothetical protein
MGKPSVIGLALAIAIFGVIANHARDMYKDKKYREMFGTLFWAVVPIAIFCLFWVVNEHPSTMARNITLGLVGAVLGAAALIWSGYAVRDWSVHAQTAGGTMSSREVLISALNDLASAIAAAPSVVIGSQVSVTAGPGSSGTIIGKQVTVTAGPGSSGTVIGEQVTVNSSTPPVNPQKAQALRNGAARVAAGVASRGEIGQLIAHSNLPGNNPAVSAALNRANQALQASDLP